MQKPAVSTVFFPISVPLHPTPSKPNNLYGNFLLGDDTFSSLLSANTPCVLISGNSSVKASFG